MIFMVAINNTPIKRKVNRILFSFQPKFLNFNAKSRIGATNSNEKVTVISTSDRVSKSQGANDVFTIAIPDIKSAFAGVGKPLKESLWVSSILKMANRNAENAAIAKARKGSHSDVVELPMSLYMTTAGNTPKLTMSASESSSLPIGEETFKRRAANPSKKSKSPASQIK